MGASKLNGTAESRAMIENSQQLAEINRKRHFALANRETNEKAVSRYMDLLKDGYTEDEAREVVKQAFDIGDKRLDRALTSRAGQFAPSTIAELESKFLTHVARVEMDAARLRRFYEGQLDRIDEARSAGEKWLDIELIEQVGGKFEGTKYKKIPLDEAELKIHKGLAETNQAFESAMKAIKADTQINIKADHIHSRSTAELERELELLRSKKVHKGEEIET